MEAILEFNGYKLIELIYKGDFDISDKDESDLEVSVGTAVSDDESKGQVRISVTACDIKNNRMVKAVVLGFFGLGDIGNKEQILAVNGTAILYPYIRAIISTVTTQDNLPAIILPTVNTNIFSKNKTSNEEN